MILARALSPSRPCSGSQLLDQKAFNSVDPSKGWVSSSEYETEFSKISGPVVACRFGCHYTGNMDDPLYQQLEKALNLLVEGSAKINFLMGKLEMKITDLEDEEIAKQIQQNLFIEQNIDVPQASRIERMVLELTMEITECSVCTEMVNKAQSIWSCKNCYNIYHLSCANKCMQATSKERF
ncbi:unnamed protein product [Nesidiocoris tenuis]|uniref:Phorbol-ester/DAG-type domain-containing protein n=1 Tax=Nesidiocoris tenuis TaxID=355587 RepID=A0A6H5GGR5_9HEMI|nr:unnamed protein product [Nesidiocoris tenuis]